MTEINTFSKINQTIAESMKKFGKAVSNITSDHHKIKSDREAFEEDAIKISDDWKQVGDDMWVVMKDPTIKQQQDSSRK